MQYRIRFADALSPALARVLQKFSDRRPLLEAAGLEMVAITQLNFVAPTYRPTPWAPVKHGGSPLRRSGALWQSIRISGLTNDRVEVGTDRAYALYHQLGTSGPYPISAKTKKALSWPGAAHPVRRVMHPGLPARPFLPIDSRGRLIPAAARRVERVLRSEVKRRLGEATGEG